MSTVTFVGAGSFGTALSTIVAAKGCRVNIFDIDEAHLKRMEDAMENVDYLPGVKLSGDYHFYTDNEAALKDADIIVFYRLNKFNAHCTNIRIKIKVIEVYIGNFDGTNICVD